MLTFETKVWEKDWEYILKDGYLETMISNCNYKFEKKHLIVNNVNNRSVVEKHCKEKIQTGVIDAYFFVEDFANEVLTHFDISLDSFKGGYYYSIAELVGIFKCKTKFLLHFSSDSYIEDKSNWISSAIEIMNEDKNIFVANPTWNKRYDEAENEKVGEIKDFYIGYGFSDQCYLIRTDDFNNEIYNEKNIESNRYPQYGGELFEKRVDAFMRNNQKFRITHKHSSYISKNFPKSWIVRKVLRKYISRQRLNFASK
jgi:hypothetical protein